MTLHLDIDMSKACAECGKTEGVADNGLCLKCMVKAMGSAALRSDTAKEARERFLAISRLASAAKKGK